MFPIKPRLWAALATLALVGGCTGLWLLPAVQNARQAARRSQFT